MLCEAFDLNTIFDSGFQVAHLRPEMANFYLRRVAKETYADDPFENYIEGDYSEKEIRNRMFASWSLEKKQPDLYKELGQHFSAIAQPLLRLYNHGQPMPDITINLMKAKPGYLMGWHEDISGRAPLLGFLYLVPDALSVDDGGQLEIARVTRDVHGDVIARDVVASITPTNGMLVLLENQTTRFQHRVVEHASDKERYLIVTTLGGSDF